MTSAALKRWTGSEWTLTRFLFHGPRKPVWKETALYVWSGTAWVEVTML